MIDPTTTPTIILAPGTLARTIVHFGDTHPGDVVTIIRFDASQGYLVRSTNLEELWLPGHVLATATSAGGNSRKPWSFRFRKQSSSSNGANSPTTVSPMIGEERVVNGIGEQLLSCPEFRDRLQDVRAPSGSRVTLQVRTQVCTNLSTQITWRKTEPDPCVMRNSGRFILSQSLEDCSATLVINNTRQSDSGTYVCILSNDIGTAQCSATLTITDIPVLKQPTIQVLSSSSVLLEWEPSTTQQQYLIEFCKFGSGEWIRANHDNPVNSVSYTLEDLHPGESYSFRIISVESHQVSLPSYTLTLPVADNLRWQQEQFKRRYIELEEIDRGRFSVVRKAQDRGTGLEVALKQVFRRKQPHKVTQAEYTLLAGMQHRNMIHAMALFDNAPLPGIDTIVLEMVKGPLLFNYIAQGDEYTESEICGYAKQIISALAWLHGKDWAHLDLKPENIMIDSTSTPPTVKLIDFGDCVSHTTLPSLTNTSPSNSTPLVLPPPASLEFAAPEAVLGQPLGPHTDAWALGVIIYVLLSGVSPFLDDSVEETTANILQGDYCFPEEYFAGVGLEGRELIRGCLVVRGADRWTVEGCLESDWLRNECSRTSKIPSSRLRTFIQRRNPMNSPITPTIPTAPSIFAE